MEFIFSLYLLYINFNKINNQFTDIFPLSQTKSNKLPKFLCNKLIKTKINIFLAGHSYIIQDEMCWIIIKNFLKKQWINVITSDEINSETSRKFYKLSKNIHWTYNIEIIWSIEYLFNQIDWIIFITSFPCWPDAIANDLIQRRIKWKKPIINLVLDEHSWEAWLITRLESFIDIIKFNLK